MESSDKPVNCFRNQIILEELEFPTTLNHSTRRHIVQFGDKYETLAKMVSAVNTKVVKTIHSGLPVLAYIQHDLIKHVPFNKVPIL